jgi:hypothetical protein
MYNNGPFVRQQYNAPNNAPKLRLFDGGAGGAIASRRPQPLLTYSNATSTMRPKNMVYDNTQLRIGNGAPTTPSGSARTGVSPPSPYDQYNSPFAGPGASPEVSDTIPPPSTSSSELSELQRQKDKGLISDAAYIKAMDKIRAKAAQVTTQTTFAPCTLHLVPCALCLVPCALCLVQGAL